MEYIKGLIVSGRVPAGHQLPTELEIARELGVSRTPVREAVKALDAAGLVEIRRGTGTYVRGDVGGSVAQLLLFQRYLEDAAPQTLMEMRQLFERTCAELAAQRRTQDDLDAMRAAIDRQRALAGTHGGGTDTGETDGSLDDFLKADLAFHRAIYAASRNELIATMANFVLDLVAPLIRRSIEVNGRAYVVRLHEAILTMIEFQNAGGVSGLYTSDPVALNMERWRIAMEESGAAAAEATDAEATGSEPAGSGAAGAKGAARP